MVGAGFHCLAKLRALVPRYVTTGKSLWQTRSSALRIAKNPLSVSKDQMRQGQACGNLLSNVLLTVAIRGAAFT
jgi:hypothetical protein